MTSLERILTVTPKHSLNLINLHNGTITSTIQFDAGTMSREPLMIDPEHCIVPKGERYLAIVNIKSGQLKQQWSCPEQLKSIHLAYNKAYFFGGGISGKVYIWHFTTGELIRIFSAHYKGVSQLSTNEDDSILFTTSLDGTVHVWSLLNLLDVKELNSVTSSTRLKPLVEFSRHSMPITGLLVTPGVTNNGNLFTCSLDRSVIQYCVSGKSVKQIWTLPAPILCMCLHPMQTQLFVGCTNNEIYIIPLYDTTHYPTPSTTTSSTTTPSSSSSTSTNSTSNSQYIASNSVYKEHIGTNNASNLFSSGHVYPSFVGHTHHITSLSISLHGTHLTSTSLDGSLIIWSIGSRQIMKQVNVGQGKNYPLSSCKVLVDTASSMKLNDEMLRKKQFPVLLRDLRTPLELHKDQNSLQFATNCFTSVPIVPQFNHSFVLDQTLDNMYYHDHLLALIDAERAVTEINGDVATMTTQHSTFQQPQQNTKSKTRSRTTAKMNDDDHDEDDQNEDDEDDNEKQQEEQQKSQRGKKASKTTSEYNDLQEEQNKLQQQRIEELEAELKKWKQTATKLYKQVGK